MQTINFVDQFVALAEEYGDGIATGDSRHANNCHARINKLLRSKDIETRWQFLPVLCRHHNSAVRLWAAAYLTEIDADSAKTTLVSCAEEQTPLGLVAEVVLDQLKNGTLKL